MKLYIVKPEYLDNWLAPGAHKPVYLKSESGDGLLLPVRVK